MQKNSKSQKIRLIIQIFFFVLIALIVVSHTLEESGVHLPFVSNASLHAICPFGGIVTFYDFVTSGTIVKKLHESSIVLMVLVFIMSIMVGPAFCGWVCPLGSFQEWIGKIGKKVFKRKYNNFVPQGLDKLLRYLRYFVLIWVIYATAKTGVLIFLEVDPYYALFNFWTGEVAIGSLIVLGLTIVGAFFVERPWCKYLCPYGALLGITNLFRIFKIRRKNNSCIQCGDCDYNCPMNIKVSEKDVVYNHQCITCLQCTSEHSCPVPNTVTLSTKGGDMK